jgi:hypothetical protein
VTARRDALSHLEDTDYPVRLARFRREHPEVMIITTMGLPTAWAGGEEITRASIGSLLDKLEEMTGMQG